MASKRKPPRINLTSYTIWLLKSFSARIKSGDATTQDLKAACDWLKTNDISGVALDSSPLSKLAAVMPEVDPELVQSRLHGR